MHPYQNKIGRRSIRLKGYDYSTPGMYFVTVCTQKRLCLFGDVFNGKMHLNDAGKMVHTAWNQLSVVFPGVVIDEFVVMPNHIHGIIVLYWGNNHKGNHKGCPYSITLGDIVGAFKSYTTFQYILGVKTQQWPPFPTRLWQRNYYEHIIRNPQSLNRIRQYILHNPLRWYLHRQNHYPPR